MIDFLTRSFYLPVACAARLSRNPLETHVYRERPQVGMVNLDGSATARLLLSGKSRVPSGFLFCVLSLLCVMEG